MNTTLRRFALSLILLLTATGTALGDPSLQGSDPFKRCDKKHEDWAQHRKEALATLHEKLLLKPDQEGAWSEWSTAFTITPKDYEEHAKQKAEREQLPALERLQKKLDRLKEHESKVQAEIDATRTFIGVLTEEQKTLFNQNFKLLKGHKGDKKERR